MGIRDWFRKRPSGDWVDPAQVSPEDALRRAREGLAETDTYIDEHGRRRKIPPGGKEPVAQALDEAEQQLRRTGG